MLEVIKSKSMIGIMVLIIGVFYISALQTKNLEENYSNEIVLNAR